MNKPMLTRAVRDTIELQSAAARFFSELARQATDPSARKLLLDIARIEQLLALDVESKVSQLTSAPLPERANTRVSGIKTAPEWAAVRTITIEQAIAVAFDCTRRAFHHHADMASKFEGRASDFFLQLAQADEDRAMMLERALDQRLADFAATHHEGQIVAATLDAVRRAGKAYSRIAKRTTRARTREFLKGMVEVCSLHAANIQGRVHDAVVFEEDDPAFEGLISATSPTLDRNVDDLAFESAMRMAMNAQKRAALVHGIQARAFPGETAQLFFDIAEAERRHAATIASVLDRMAPEVDAFDAQPASPLADAPRESWTCPAGTVEKLEEEHAPPSLRLVAG